MGYSNQYHIEWFNALTGDFLLQQEYPSSLYGNLELTFPGTLTGDEVSPILFFTIHPAGGSLKSSSQDTTDSDKVLVSNLSADTTIKDIKPTIWNGLSNQNNNLIVHVSPNPTSDILNISIETISIENYQWYLTSDKGDILLEGALSNKHFNLEIGSFEAGVYFFVVESTTRYRVITKIVKT